jgi:hypothetical protein
MHRSEPNQETPVRHLLCLSLVLSACTFATQLPGSSGAPGSLSVPRTAESPAIRRGETTPATFNKNGVSLPPGPAPSLEPATCGAAQDHCLHPDSWFARYHDNTATTCYPNGGGFYLWYPHEAGISPLDAGTIKDVHRTRPARPSDLEPGMMVVAWGHRDKPQPTSTTEAQIYQGWVFVEVAAVEGDQVRITTVDGLHPIDRFRVIVETRAFQ